jgi:DNA-binding GntR family transcriptional regulator
MTTLPPVSPQTTAQRVADSIRGAILGGRIPLGEKVHQTRVAEQLGVSQSMVREALLRLEQEGFVRTVPYKGIYVQKLGDKDLHELFTLRSILEPFALRNAMTLQPHSAVIEPLTLHFHEMLAAAAKGKADDVATGDLDFHRTIVSLSGHSLLLSIWSGIAPRIRLFLLAKYPLYDSPLEVAETHRPVLEAIERGDADEAARSLEEHIVGSAVRAITILKQRGLTGS